MINRQEMNTVNDYEIKLFFYKEYKKFLRRILSYKEKNN